jgi:formylglycine-generating enzyme required for sulfatase activity
MLGNVGEWTHDWYDDYPERVTGPVGPVRGSYRVYRGGSWFDITWVVRAANRVDDAPAFRDFTLGFCLARSN